MKRIVALVDHSVYAESVASHAAWLGSASQARVDVVHVVDPLDPAVVHVGMAGLAVGGPGIIAEEVNYSDEKIEEMRTGAQLLVDRLASRIEGTCGSGAVGRVLVGEFRHTIDELQKEAEVLVLGKRGETADFVGLTLGSSLRNAVGIAQVPLLIAPRVFRPIAGWVLAVGDDRDLAGSLTSLLSTNLLPTMQCEVVHVGETTSEIEGVLEAIDRVLEEFGHPSHRTILGGDPVRVLAGQLASDETRLLAIGKFGVPRLLPRLLGDTVANDLTKAVLGPILVLKP